MGSSLLPPIPKLCRNRLSPGVGLLLLSDEGGPQRSSLDTVYTVGSSSLRASSHVLENRAGKKRLTNDEADGRTTTAKNTHPL
ncbi:hypothetical protein ILYODFUR_008397 [Ilyodon furcidens]|uniref:Uncharacterized protein n=1 Tax=Ilyodon furcidens TaxID=33524 RepID=A0ABV0UG76_9TELE